MMSRYENKKERYDLAREIAEEGIILLKNENTLPLGKEKIAVFGRTQNDIIKCGTGSAFCTCEYCAQILQSLTRAGINCDEILSRKYADWSAKNPIASYDVWGSGSHINEEMPLSEKEIAEAAERAEKAVFIIGRTAGENDDVLPVTGDYYLSDGEELTLSLLGKYFGNVTVIVNSGNLIDLSFTRRDYVKAALLISMPGMEGGQALARVLCGEVSPSGKLTDTAVCAENCPSSRFFGSRGGIIQKYKEDIYVGYRYFETFADEKENVIFPFGYGLSYTEFEMSSVSFSADEDEISVTLLVKNIGAVSGKEVAMLYSSSPAGALGKPRYELRAFAKTRLLGAGESEMLTLCFATADMASFDDCGETGARDCFVLEAGEYGIFFGNNAEKLSAAGSLMIEKMRVVKHCTHIDTRLEERLCGDDGYEVIDHIMPDPSEGAYIAPEGETRVKIKRGNGTAGALINVSVHGTYVLRAETENGEKISRGDAEIKINGRLLEADFAVFSVGKTEISVACDKNIAFITVVRDETPIKISENESIIEGGRFCECALYVVSRQFHDTGAVKHGFSLARMHTPGRYATYRLDVEKAGVYEFSLRYYNPYGDMPLADCFSVLVSNVRRDVGDIMLPKTAEEGEGFVCKSAEPFRLALPKGECYLKFVSVTRTSPEIAYIQVNPCAAEEQTAVSHRGEAHGDTATVTEREYTRRIPDGYENGIFMQFVKGNITARDITAKMSDDELAALTCGNEKGQIGYSEAYGIPEVYWADGPVGLRLERNTTVYPSGTMLASTWNTALAEEFGRAISAEAKGYKTDMWLAPGMNIHRNPLCGRGFEYYSEDPLLTGKMAAAVVRGAQSECTGATIKHFAANSTEYRRLQSDSYISARALREIYMRGFEIAIKEGQPLAIMTSYNFINGKKVPEDSVFCDNIIRDEFGFEGVLVTDWENNSVHVRELAAGHDLKMASGNAPSVAEAIRNGTLSRERVEQSACRVLEFIKKTAAKNI